MRIIGGKVKSRKLLYPKCKSIRPTMDRVRETIFNILGNSVNGAVCLDLFAGSGSLGFEALSRFADKVFFVDFSAAAIKVIKANMNHLGFSDKSIVFLGDATDACRRLNKNKFDIIFMDAPYGSGLTKKTLMKIYQFDILSPAGIMVVEHNSDETLVCNEGYVIYKEKDFGGTKLSFFARSESNETKSNISGNF